MIDHWRLRSCDFHVPVQHGRNDSLSRTRITTRWPARYFGYARRNFKLSLRQLWPGLKGSLPVRVSVSSTSCSVADNWPTGRLPLCSANYVRCQYEFTSYFSLHLPADLIHVRPIAAAAITRSARSIVIYRLELWYSKNWKSLNLRPRQLALRVVLETHDKSSSSTYIATPEGKFRLNYNSEVLLFEHLCREENLFIRERIYRTPNETAKNEYVSVQFKPYQFFPCRFFSRKSRRVEDFF